MTQTDATRNQAEASHGGMHGARDSASQVSARASETIDANPLAVLAGGLAIGALAGALIPRTERERELLRPVGAKLGATAAAAVAAAKEAGRSEIEQRGLTPEAARDQAKTLFDNIAKAATGAATAAAQSAKQEATGATGEQPSTDVTTQPESTGQLEPTEVAGEAVPSTDPHRQVMAGDRETSFNPSV